MSESDSSRITTLEIQRLAICSGTWSNSMELSPS